MENDRAIYAHMGYNASEDKRGETLDTDTGTIKVRPGQPIYVQGPPKRKMWPTFKARILDLMELADAARIFPRLFMVGYGSIVIHSVTWYRDLGVPTSEQTAFIGIIAAAFAPMLKWYMETGRDWTVKMEDEK